MRQTLSILAVLTTALAVASVAAGTPRNQRSAIAEAVASPSRTPANVARDPYRHPVDTLNFFGVKPGSKVVEIWPGGGWYSEILAPLTRARGAYYAAIGPGYPDGGKAVEALKARDPALYGHTRLVAFPAETGQPKVPDGSADIVLTFRNVHNWRMGYKRGGTDYAPEAFKQMFAMLRHGGTLGVVDHRLPESASDERETSSGYVKVSTVRRLAEQAGFVFVGDSQINANPRDTADWPKGVWTLPPTYTLKDVDRAKYAAIGESDRMTLKFRKP